jgi:hypothetical protein
MRLLIALKIMLRAVVGVIFTPVALRGLRSDVRRLVARSPQSLPIGPVLPPVSTTSTLTGNLEGANPKGVRLNGHPDWFDYGVTFRGTPVSKNDIGKSVELTLIHAKSGSFVRSIRILEEVPTAAPSPVPGFSPPIPALAAPNRGATDGQIGFVRKLAEKAALSAEDLEVLSQSRFKTALAALTEAQMSQMISFLGGYARRGDRRRR